VPFLWFGCVKMNFDEFVYVSKVMYENTMDPIAITNEKLNICWANNEAIKRFPSLTLQDGVLELLNEYEIPELFEILKSGKSFLAKKLYEPFNEVSIKLIPVLEDEDLVGCQVFFGYDGTGEYNLPSKHPEDVIAAFSNEYKMPLMVIFSTLGLIARHLEGSDDDITKSYIKLITQNSYRILRLSNNLTEVSRYRSGIAKLNLKTGDLCEYVRSLCEAAGILTRSIGIPLECVVPEKRIVTSFDPERLTLAFYNLISNSCKYTQEGNRICVKLEEQGEKVVVSVSDKGEGINSEILSRIFEPYFSYKSESSISGAGLGLSIVKFVITQHGGTIAVRSSESKGTTVAFTLPLRKNDDLPDYIAQNGADYLADRFSSLYIEMSDVCGCPLP
jgi:signal transduction histidine kinase